jgi:hypothetical protein
VSSAHPPTRVAVDPPEMWIFKWPSGKVHELFFSFFFIYIYIYIYENNQNTLDVKQWYNTKTHCGGTHTLSPTPMYVDVVQLLYTKSASITHHIYIYISGNVICTTPTQQGHNTLHMGVGPHTHNRNTTPIYMGWVPVCVGPTPCDIRAIYIYIYIIFLCSFDF